MYKLLYLIPSLSETRSPIAISFLLFIYLASFFICLLIYKAQPFYSRGFGPFTTLLLLILQLGIETRNYDLIPIEQRSLCIYQAYFLFPIQQLIFVMILFYTIRYFSIIRINSMKNNINITIKDGVKHKEYSWKIYFLKYLTKWWFILIIMLVYYFFSLVIFTIVFGITPLLICEYQTLTNLRILNTVLMSIIFISLLLLILSDIIWNYQLIFKCQIYQLFFKKVLSLFI